MGVTSSASTRGDDPAVVAVGWVIEVEADTGKIVTQPLALSSEAVVWLESCPFRLPGSRSVQQATMVGLTSPLRRSLS